MVFKKATSIVILISLLIQTLIGDFIVFALTPNDINNKVFHYDLQDIDWDWNSLNEPNNWDNIQTIVDKFNWFDAYQNNVTKQGTYNTTWINNFPSISLDWIDDLYEIDDNLDIASGTGYKEKTFAIVFNTSDDVNTLQTIYEQGWKEKWYWIQIESGKLYAWVWNTVDWPVWEEYKIADLWAITTDTAYNIIITQNSDTSNNLKIFSNWKVINSITNVSEQTTHGACILPWPFSCYLFSNWWSIWLWATKNDTLQLSNTWSIQWDELNHFKWYIWELLSWNTSLTDSDAIWLFKYLDDKWLLQKPEVTINKPEDVWIVSSWNFDIKVSFNDFQNWDWIDTSTDILELYKWNWVDWWVDIAGGLVNLPWKVISNYNATYPVVWITDWKYKIIYKISKTNWLEWENQRLFHVWELLPNNIPNIVFHYDAQDTNWDWNLTNNPADWSSIWTLVDKINSYNATQWIAWNTPTLLNNTINSYPSLSFDWNDYYDIANQNDINTNVTYNQKSFASVFKTGNDVNTFQNIYEQGWNARWYSFIIHNWHVYAWVWNNIEWDAWHQYKSVDLWPAQPNTVYFAMIVQDSSTWADNTNTLKIYLNGNLSSFQDHTDQQYNHPGWISIWRVNWNTVRASDNTLANAWNYLNWNMWELISWNYALDQAEINGVQEYFSNKWWVVTFSEKYPIPSPTSESTPTYTFITNRSWTLSFGGSCNSTATTAIAWENTINLDSDWAWWSLADWTYNDCIITLTDDVNWFNHVLNITPFTVEWASYTLTEVTPISTPTPNHFPQYTFNSPISWTIEYYGWCDSNTVFANIWDNTINLNYLDDWLYSTCYLRVNNWTEVSEFLNISTFEIITSPPSINSSSINDNQLFPIWDFTFDFNYTDDWYIDSLTADTELYKYISWSWYSLTDISTSHITLDSANNTVSDFTANWISYWRYKVIFKISNTAWTISTMEKEFYVDEIEFTIDKSEIDIWNINSYWTEYFSDELTVTVKTVWAWFNVIMNKTTELNDWTNNIDSWDWSDWFWYDQDIYSWNINQITTNEIIWTQISTLNINWDKNTYTYKIKAWALITEEQFSWEYTSTLDFWISLSY